MTVQTQLNSAAFNTTRTLIFIADINGSEPSLMREHAYESCALSYELREQESNVVVLLSFKTCYFFVIIFGEEGSNLHSICDQHGLP